MHFLRFILALLMLCIFMFRDLSRPIIAADYLVNMDRYRQACINKLKPKSGCNGRCQMMRKMGAAEGTSTSEAVPPVKPFLGESAFETVAFPSGPGSFTLSLSHAVSCYSEDYASSYMDDIFHPPSI